VDVANGNRWMLIKSTFSNEAHHAECGWKSNGKAFLPKQFSAYIISVGKVGRKKKKGTDARDGCAELLECLSFLFL
jgi:hypothetical protein